MDEDTAEISYGPLSDGRFGVSFAMPRSTPDDDLEIAVLFGRNMARSLVGTSEDSARLRSVAEIQLKSVAVMLGIPSATADEQFSLILEALQKYVQLDASSTN